MKKWVFIVASASVLLLSAGLIVRAGISPGEVVQIFGGGNLATVDDAGALKVNAGTVMAADPSNVGAKGSAAPANAGQIGGPDDAGVLQAPIVSPGDPATTAQGLVVRPVNQTAADLLAQVSGTVTANVGTTNGLALDTSLTGGTQKTQITDNVNGSVAVKAASTPAAAADKALVCSLSPNSPLPTGSNALGSVTVTGTSNVNVSPGGTAPSFSMQQAVASGFVKASAGTLFSFHCINRNASSRYLQLFNSASGPSGGASALNEFLEPANGMIVIGSDYFTTAGEAFGTGIAFGNSTTSGTFTAATAADHDCSFVFN